MSDSDSDSDDEINPNQVRCAVCWQGPNRNEGPLIRPCGCHEGYGYYHWPCVAQYIEKNLDPVCGACGTNYQDERIQRYQYTPTFIQYLIYQVFRLRNNDPVIILTAVVAIIGTIAAVGSLAFASELYEYIIILILIAILTYALVDQARYFYRCHLINGEYPNRMLRLLNHPTSPNGVIEMNISEAVRRHNEELMKMQAHENVQFQQAQQQVRQDTLRRQSTIPSTATTPRVSPSVWSEGSSSQLSQPYWGPSSEGPFLGEPGPSSMQQRLGSSDTSQSKAQMMPFRPRPSYSQVLAGVATGSQSAQQSPQHSPRMRAPQSLNALRRKRVQHFRPQQRYSSDSDSD